MESAKGGKKRKGRAEVEKTEKTEKVEKEEKDQEGEGEAKQEKEKEMEKEEEEEFQILALPDCPDFDTSATYLPFVDDGKTEEERKREKEEEEEAKEIKKAKGQKVKGPSTRFYPPSPVFFEWEEFYLGASVAKIPPVTMYDLFRTATKQIEGDDHTTTLAVRDLNEELTCPVCLNIVQNARTVMDCLHRFCAECISKSLRLGKKECPKCRTKCMSQRHLRPDPNFDELVRTLYPDRDAYEKEEETLIQKINQSKIESWQQSFKQQAERHNVTTTTRSHPPRKRPSKPKKVDENRMEDEDEREMVPRAERKREAVLPPTATSLALEMTDRQVFSSHLYYFRHIARLHLPPPPLVPSAESVEVGLAPDPRVEGLRELEFPYVTINKKTPLLVLTRLVRSQLAVPTLHLKIITDINRPDQTALNIDTGTHIETVLTKYWNVPRDLILYYSTLAN